MVVLNGVGPDEGASPPLLMMVLVGGRDRTLGEFRALAREAGLEVRAAARQPSGRFVVECLPDLTKERAPLHSLDPNARDGRHRRFGIASSPTLPQIVEECAVTRPRSQKWAIRGTHSRQADYAVTCCKRH